MKSHRPLSRALLQPILQTIIVVLAIGRPPPSLAGQTLKQIADTFAGSAVDQGTVVEAGVGIGVGDAPPRYFSYGQANQILGRPFTPDGIFEIGSVTKIFTTNILGQAVYRGELKL